VIRHFCSECRSQLPATDDECCPDHPNAAVDSIGVAVDDDNDIRELESEAIVAHDVEQMILCQRATLNRDAAARAECERVILEARASAASTASPELFDSETNEPVSPEDLNIDDEQYAVFVGQSLGIPGTGHVRVRVSPTGKSRRVYAQ